MRNRRNAEAYHPTGDPDLFEAFCDEFTRELKWKELASSMMSFTEYFLFQSLTHKFAVVLGETNVLTHADQTLFGNSYRYHFAIQTADRCCRRVRSQPPRRTRPPANVSGSRLESAGYFLVQRRFRSAGH
jgi:hypothetical protein